MSDLGNLAAKCSRCGGEVPPNAPEGLCPRCVMEVNLATETHIDTGGLGPGGTVVTRPQPSPPLPPSEVAKLFPQYEILEPLGRGGMGAVYKARQPRLDRFVAIKLLSHEKVGDPQFAERFQREARTLAKLNHPNIVTVYDFGETQGRFYLVMEFVDGVTLRQSLQTRKLAPEEALAIVPKICEALQYAHARGIVHRDIKPENILLDKSGQVKIADFGIAKISGQPSLAGLTQDKQVIGTPHYMAPEQVEKPQCVDHRADIFSLGVVFYEMLTGELPLGRFAPPSKKVSLDVRLDEVVLRALEKEPERRYQQATQLQAQVETIASSSAAGVRSSPAPAPAPAAAALGGPSSQPRSRRVSTFAVIAGIAALFLLLVIALPVLLLLVRFAHGRQAQPPAPNLVYLPPPNVVAAPRVVQYAPPDPGFPAPQIPGPGTAIDTEVFLAEVPGDFQLRANMDHNAVRRQRGVRLMNLAWLRTTNGGSAELLLSGVAVATNDQSLLIRVKPTLDRNKIVYDLEVHQGAKVEPTSGVGRAYAQMNGGFKRVGILNPGEPMAFTLSDTKAGRRLLGIAIFRPADPNSSNPTGKTDNAGIWNPEIEQEAGYSQAAPDGMLFFSFETGRLLKPPMPVPFDESDPTRWTFSSGLREWIRQEDLDVLFVLQDKYWHAISLDVQQQLIQAPATLEAYTAEQLAALVGKLSPADSARNSVGHVTASSYFIPYDDKTRAPAAAFCTRSGVKGLFKWVSVTSPEKGIKIRYRLLPKPVAAEAP